MPICVEMSLVLALPAFLRWKACSSLYTLIEWVTRNRMGSWGFDSFKASLSKS